MRFITKKYEYANLDSNERRHHGADSQIMVGDWLDPQESHTLLVEQSKQMAAEHFWMRCPGKLG